MKDITPYNEKNQRHGYSITYWTNYSNAKCYEGNFINGNPDGIFLYYYIGNIPYLKTYYIR